MKMKRLTPTKTKERKAQIKAIRSVIDAQTFPEEPMNRILYRDGKAATFMPNEGVNVESLGLALELVKIGRGPGTDYVRAKEMARQIDRRVGEARAEGVNRGVKDGEARRDEDLVRGFVTLWRTMLRDSPVIVASNVEARAIFNALVKAGY